MEETKKPEPEPVRLNDGTLFSDYCKGLVAGVVEDLNKEEAEKPEGEKAS